MPRVAKIKCLKQRCNAYLSNSHSGGMSTYLTNAEMSKASQICLE